VKLIHEKTGVVLANDLREARGLQKLKGLMFLKAFGPGDGLYIPWRNSVHNCFVRFSIDVIFLNQHHSVVKVIRGFKPWQFSAIYFRARHVVELPAGTVIADVSEGDRLLLTP